MSYIDFQPNTDKFNSKASEILEKNVKKITVYFLHFNGGKFLQYL